jgi:hypothetical protein
MVAVPAVTPVTTPVAAFTLALAALLLVQVPPVVAVARVVLLPMQAVGVPVIVAGFTFIVTVLVVVHPALVW